jgi:G:T-mismatch repair DNA endonuclease (very short patch repair protein)
LARICSFDGCTNKINSHGYCVSHATQLRNKQKLRPLKKYGVTKCSVDKCDNLHSGKGLCKTHYDRWKKYGSTSFFPDPEETKRKIQESRKNFKHNEDTKQKISESLKGKPRYDLRGKKRSEDTRKKISQANAGKKHSEESKRKQSERMMGTKHTEETKRKISAIVKGRKHTEDSKRKLSKAHTGKILKDSTKKKISIARSKQKFPSKDTKIEVLTQSILEKNNIDFVKHKNFKLLKSHHQADLVIEPNKVIEVFGDYWHFNPKKYDGESVQKVRGKEVKVKEVWKYDKYVIDGMKHQGYKVLVVWESELKDDLDKTTKKILKFAKS